MWVDNFAFDSSTGMVVYTPSTGTVKYEFKLLVDNKINLQDKIDTNWKTVFQLKEGTNKIEVVEYDASGNATTKVSEEYPYNIKPVVETNKDSLIVARISLIAIVLVIILLFTRFLKSVRLEKRLSKYSINSKEVVSNSWLENVLIFYKKIVKGLGKSIKQSVFLTRASKRYKKYADAFDICDNDPIYIVSEKIITGLIYLLIIIILKLKSSFIQPYEAIIPFLIGYYLLDVYYIYKYNKYRHQLEEDLLKSITIMNNAFKSGRSIKQSIDLVVKELDGPINKEFSIISKELEYGLDIDVSFKRFADRVKLDEAVYLTSSLSILNKTGGNIIEVFSTIENTLYNKKKLNIELKSLTASSRLIMYVLIFIPIIFILFINIINKNYFDPLFKNPLGIALMFLIFIIYIVYIFVVRKVMKVRM